MSALAWVVCIAGGAIGLAALFVWLAVRALRSEYQHPPADVRASSSVKDFPPRDTVTGRDDAQLHALLSGAGVEMPFYRVKQLTGRQFDRALVWACSPGVTMPAFLVPYATGKKP